VGKGGTKEERGELERGELLNVCKKEGGGGWEAV